VHHTAEHHTDGQNILSLMPSPQAMHADQSVPVQYQQHKTALSLCARVLPTTGNCFLLPVVY
jgi:hypothetical protein